MSRTTNWEADLECVDLQDLLDSKAQQTLAGQYQPPSQLALVELAREALGWQSWARDNSVPLTGNPMVLTQQAARAMNMNVAEANAAFAQAQAQSPIPALFEQGGDAACWQRIADVNPAIYQVCCPAEVQTRLNEQPSSHHQPETEVSDCPDSTYTADASRDVFPSIRIEVEPQANPFLSSEQQRNLKLAQMGREIVQIAGTEEGGKLAFEGKANYTITVNLNTNTMRITARDRGETPILIDQNGNIDHANSKVTDQDVDKFKRALQILHRQPQPVNFER